MYSKFCSFCAAILAVSVVSSIPQASAADPAVKCESAKLKESAKYASCRLKAESKGVKKGLPADFTKCETKFTAKFNKVESKAGPGVCPSEGDEMDVNSSITVHTAALAARLGGSPPLTCGNANADPGEQCDGADLRGLSCFGLGFSGGTLGCDASCVIDTTGCIPSTTCGNDAVDGTDQCDGFDLAGADCTTLGFTGGTLACGAFCHYDLSGCTATCNGLVPGIDPILPATGQTTAFGPGSDGDVQAGAALSYTDNGDGTITDNNTGLMWEKKDDSGGIHGQNNTYTWCGTSCGTTNIMDGTITTTFLDTLNDVGGGGASCFAGHCDWRIPNKKELESLDDSKVSGFAPIDAAFLQATCTGCTDVTLATCSCTASSASSAYWSSTTSPFGVWVVFFSNGVVGNAGKTFTLPVRAVRGGL